MKNQWVICITCILNPYILYGAEAQPFCTSSSMERYKLHSSCCKIDDLPDDVMLKIQDYLPLKSLINFSRTNRRHYITTHITKRNFCKQLERFIQELPSNELEDLENILDMQLINKLTFMQRSEEEKDFLSLNIIVNILKHLNFKSFFQKINQEPMDILRLNLEKKIKAIKVSKDFLKPDMINDDLEDILNLFIKIPVEEHDSLSKQSLRLITPTMNMAACIRILSAFFKIHPGKWGLFEIYYTHLMTETMNDQQQVNIIEALANVNPLEWQSYMTLIFGFTTENMNDEQHVRIIKALANIPSLYWERLSLETFDLFDDITLPYERIRIIETLSTLNPKEWRSFIKALPR